jgi:hypothetical protein
MLMPLHQAKSHPVFSKMVQHLFGVSHNKIEGGCRMILMEAKENPGHKISRQSCAGCETDNFRDFPIQIQVPQNPLELGKDMSKSFSELGSARSQKSRPWPSG